MRTYLGIIMIASCTLLLACKDCVTCPSGGTTVEICKQSGTVYTDTAGNEVSWDIYKEQVLTGCE